jgi:uncharacterized membrane protein YkvA (DUF1232 family)
MRNNSLVNVFEYFRERRIPRLEKFLVLGFMAAYIISPLDLWPGMPFDDIGVSGLVLAYMIWRTGKVRSIPEKSADNANLEKAAESVPEKPLEKCKSDIIDVEEIR